MRLDKRKMQLGGLAAVLMLVAIGGITVVRLGIFAKPVRCDRIDFVAPGDWDNHFRDAMRDEAGSGASIGGHAFQIIGSTCDLNAEIGLPEPLKREKLHSRDVAWRFFAGSEIGTADIFALKRRSGPIYLDVPMDVSITVLIIKNGGDLVHLESFGELTVSLEGVVSLQSGRMAYRSGTLPDIRQDRISVLKLPKAGEMGASTLKVQGDRLLLNGVIGLQTYRQFREIRESSTEPKTVVFEKVDGTFSYSATAYSGRLIREAGWSTYAGRDSEIYSGGVDLFLAGTRRSVETGAEFGVHPGCCYVGEDAGDLPADHPYHRQLLDYSSEMLGTPAGPEFYNFTNRVVTHDELHLLSEQELLRLKVATEIIPRDEGAE